MDQNSSIAMETSKLLNIISILRDAIYLPAKNKKLILSSMLLCFVPNSLLLMGNHISIYPLLLGFLMKLYLITKEDTSAPQFFEAVIGLRSDAKAIVQVHIFIIILSYIVSTFSMMMIVHSSLLVYSGKLQSSLNDALVRLKSTWIHVFVTRIYFSLLYTGYTVLSVYLIAIPMLHKNDLMVSFVIGGLFAMLGRLLSVYLAMVWTVGVMVSVAEESCYGLEALWRGGEIVKGRRIQGFLIALMLLLAEGVFTGGGITEAKNAAGFILIIFLVLMKMFSYMIYSVFYCECRKEVCSTRVVVANNGEILP